MPQGGDGLGSASYATRSSGLPTIGRSESPLRTPTASARLASLSASPPSFAFGRECRPRRRHGFHAQRSWSFRVLPLRVLFSRILGKRYEIPLERVFFAIEP